MKGSETFDHTADIGIRAWGDSPEELYEALAEGVADLICPRGQVQGRLQHRLTVDAADPEALAVAFLGELAGWSQRERMCVGEVKVDRLTDTHLEARASVEAIDPTRHELGPEIKAVTYHLLEVRRRGGRWVGQVLLDI
jgi:SHS2 domain-containing protein